MATDKDTAHDAFPIFPPQLKDYISPELASFLTKQFSEDTDNLYFDDDAHDKAKMVEYFCLHRFPIVQLFDGKHVEAKQLPDDFPGKLLRFYHAKAGLMIYEYEYAIIIGVGDMAFAEYSNYGRMIKSIYQVYDSLLPDVVMRQDWRNVAIAASHQHLENVSWAIAKTKDIPVAGAAPAEEATIILDRLMKEPEKAHEWIKPVLGSSGQG